MDLPEIFGSAKDRTSSTTLRHGEGLEKSALETRLTISLFGVSFLSTFSDVLRVVFERQEIQFRLPSKKVITYPHVAEFVLSLLLMKKLSD